MSTRYKDTGCELHPTCLNCPLSARSCPPFSPGSKKKIKNTGRFVHIGFGNFIDRSRITKVTKRARHGPTQTEGLETLRNAGLLITMSAGRRARSIIQMDSGHFILCYLTPGDLGY